MTWLALRWARLRARLRPQARVRCRVIVEGDGFDVGVEAGQDQIVEAAKRLVPRNYIATRVYGFEQDDADADAARTWMDRQCAREKFAYRPFIGEDCFRFARNALRRANISVLLLLLYLQRGGSAGHRHVGVDASS